MKKQIDMLMPLHEKMKAEGILKHGFHFSYKGKEFSCLFIADSVPMQLMFGIKNHNYYFECRVNNEYEVTPFIPDLNVFCKIMGFKYDSNNRYKPVYFFDEFNEKLRSMKHRTVKLDPKEILEYVRDIEEKEKLSFYGWLSHEKNGKSVTPRNLEKTRLLLGEEAYIRCKENNISSKWTV